MEMSPPPAAVNPLGDTVRSLQAALDATLDPWTLVCLMPDGLVDRPAFLTERAAALRQLVARLATPAGQLDPVWAGIEAVIAPFQDLARFRELPRERVGAAVGALLDAHRRAHAAVEEFARATGVEPAAPAASDRSHAGYVESIRGNLYDIFQHEWSQARPAPPS